VRTHLDASLIQEMEALLIADEDDLRNRVRHRHPADVADTWKHHERRVRPSLDVGADLVQRILDLRRHRLQREGEELRFLQMDAQAEDIEGATSRYAYRVMLANKARDLIRWELLRQNETDGKW